MPRGIIRKARLGDAHGIAVVHVSVSRETYAHLLPAAILDQFSVERRAKQWHEMIETPDRTDVAIFVAEDAIDKTILGFACCSRQRSELLVEKGFGGECQAIYLLPSAQSCGIGRTLMAEMARHLSSLALSGGACWVFRENGRARRFYEALGGEIVSEQTVGPSTANVLTEVAYGWRHLDSLFGD